MGGKTIYQFLIDFADKHWLINEKRLIDWIKEEMEKAEARKKGTSEWMLTSRNIRKYIKHIFVINCVAGVSRSAAIAKIVCEMKGENSSWICPPHYTPNPYVYGLLHKLK